MLSLKSQECLRWVGKVKSWSVGGIFLGHAVPEKQGSEGGRGDRKRNIDQHCWWQYWLDHYLQALLHSTYCKIKCCFGWAINNIYCLWLNWFQKSILNQSQLIHKKFIDSGFHGRFTRWGCAVRARRCVGWQSGQTYPEQSNDHTPPACVFLGSFRKEKGSPKPRTHCNVYGAIGKRITLTKDQSLGKMNWGMRCQSTFYRSCTLCAAWSNSDLYSGKTPSKIMNVLADRPCSFCHKHQRLMC